MTRWYLGDRYRESSEKGEVAAERIDLQLSRSSQGLELSFEECKDRDPQRGQDLGSHPVPRFSGDDVSWDHPGLFL